MIDWNENIQDWILRPPHFCRRREQRSVIVARGGETPLWGRSGNESPVNQSDTLLCLSRRLKHERITRIEVCDEDLCGRKRGRPTAETKTTPCQGRAGDLAIPAGIIHRHPQTGAKYRGSGESAGARKGGRHPKPGGKHRSPRGSTDARNGRAWIRSRL